jgi:hypothetical protein
MGMEKKKKRGKCPFRGDKICSTQCVFYRKGFYYYEDKSEPSPFEDCAINIIANNLESMHNKAGMLQKEVAQTKNIMALGMMSNIGTADPEETKQKLIRIIDVNKADQNLITDNKE